MNSFTLCESINIDGIGLHTGVKTNITLNPAAQNSGIFLTVLLRNKENVNIIKNLP